MWILAERLYGVDWPVLNAREFATLCVPGGNALVAPVSGFRAVPHIDPVHHAARCLARARALEEQARAWFTPEHLAEVAAQGQEVLRRAGTRSLSHTCMARR